MGWLKDALSNAGDWLQARSNEFTTWLTNTIYPNNPYVQNTSTGPTVSQVLNATDAAISGNSENLNGVEQGVMQGLIDSYEEKKQEAQEGNKQINDAISNIGNEIKEWTGDQEIKDETETNAETGINTVGIDDTLSALQKKYWEREDQIRKETQEREDTAYQRAVADMKAAGINPNLINVNPAQSGGGITSATGQDGTGVNAELDQYLTLLEKEIDIAFKEDENSKDRFTQLLGTVLIILATKGKIK